MVPKAQGFFTFMHSMHRVKFAAAPQYFPEPPSRSRDTHKSLACLGTRPSDWLLTTAGACGSCCQSQPVSQWGDGGGGAKPLLRVNGHSAAAREHDSKLLAVGASGRREGPGASAWDPRRGGTGFLGCNILKR